MKDYVFLLGRPGCGKSFVFETIVKSIKETGKISRMKRMDDFPILKELLDKDTSFKRHVRKDSGFQVTDWTIVDEVLATINSRIPAIKKENDLVFVEFARDNYLSALKNFSPEMFSKSLILYIYCPFEICLARNKKRFKEQKENALDDHIVPPDLMKTYYRKDDIEEIYLKNRKKLNEFFTSDYIVIDNSKESVSFLLKQFDAAIEKILGSKK